MRTIDYEYHLPENLIAQFPTEKRDDCRLICLKRITRSIEHRRFDELPGLLQAGDRLILNNTKVLPARVFVRKKTGVRIEFFFTTRIDQYTWKALTKPARHAQEGKSVYLEKDPSISLKINKINQDGTREVSLEESCRIGVESIEELQLRFGEIPLPHYIKRSPVEIDKNAYQTVFAQNPGAVASPTAGLHFTENLINRLKEKGIDFTYLTLHVGIGTFRPVDTDDPRNHPMHEEQFVLTAQAAEEMQRTKKNGGRNIAVGTTVVRTLEHCSNGAGIPVASSGSTRLLILPGFTFKAIDGIITNFHVPRSTLLMLVCAFAGTDFTLEAYQEAIRERYRFFSYGDAMLIL
jgi:S-adenosylmethionine:tRNA ribosyltransferase-isomerase